MALPLVPGLTQTEQDAQPLVYRLADVLERNPALMLADQSQIMDVISKIAEQRSTVNDQITAAQQALGSAWDKETDPSMQAEIAGWIMDMSGDEQDND